MTTDEFEIVIKKNGTIYVRFDDVDEKKVRHYKEIFEEVIGPTREVTEIGDEGTPPGEVGYSEKGKKKEEEKDTGKERLQH